MVDMAGDAATSYDSEHDGPRRIATSFAVQLCLVLVYLAAAALVPGGVGDKVAALAALLLGVTLGAGVSCLSFRFLLEGRLEAYGTQVRRDTRALVTNATSHMDAALAAIVTTTAGAVLSDQALLSVEANPKSLRRVVIASADGPDEFAANPKDRGSTLDFGSVVIRNLQGGVAYEWWSLDSRKAMAAWSDARGFVEEFGELAQMRLVSSEDWARSPFSFDTIFLAFKDGHTDGYMQLPSEDQASVHWIRLPQEVRRDFQGVIESWREPRAQHAVRATNRGQPRKQIRREVT